MMLTAEQTRLLEYLRERAKTSKIGPTITEMGQALGIKGRHSVHERLVALEERGFIRRIPHKARAIELIDQARRRTPLSEYSNEELSAEWHRRARRFAGDPSIGISSNPASELTAHSKK